MRRAKRPGALAESPLTPITTDDFVEYCGDLVSELSIMASRIGLPSTSIQLVLLGNVLTSEARTQRAVHAMAAKAKKLGANYASERRGTGR